MRSRLKFMTMLGILVILSLAAQAQQPKKFKKKERKLIEAEAPNVPFRILTIENEEDSVFLRKECRNVNLEKDKELITYFKKRFLVTVLDPKNMGVGIAAPQVGLQRRMLLVQRFDKEDKPMELYLNPSIVEYSDSTQFGPEGCLSIPNRTENVFRAQEIKIKYLDEEGKQHIEEVSGFTSVIFQHEIDHLNGILYIDHLSRE